MRKIIQTVVIVIIVVLQLNAGVHYVSKTGNSTPPYASWATAVDNIQKAIDISYRGDTIYVGNGTYEDTVRMTAGIALIGGGMDSCIIDTREISRPTDFYAVQVNDSCLFTGFHVIVSKDLYNLAGTGIACVYAGTGSLIEYNKITDAGYAIDMDGASPVVKNNIIAPGRYGMGIDLVAMSFRFYPVIDSNYFYIEGTYGIAIQFGTKPTITNNIFNITGVTGTAYSSGLTDTVKFYNNIIICDSILDGIENAQYPTLTINNIIIGKTNYAGINGASRNVIMNNIVQGGGGYGLNAYDGSPIFKYNNSWNNRINFKNFVPDSTNLSVAPMFVNKDSLDFHLQKYSQMIDKGSPDLLDKDGTRSDIGVYGGLLGESYTYRDIAPRAPGNITGNIKDSKLTLNWAKNTEADFAFYRIYKDTVSTMVKDTAKRYFKLTDTTFTDNLAAGKNYYYKLTATDNQGNESALSEGAGTITGVDEKPKLNIPDYMLYQNYPNPFNPATTISYRLKQNGYVKINIYDIKGSLVKTIVNKHMSAGYYETEFNASGMNLASGIYLYKIDVKNENNIPVYTSIKKMIMLK